jgi:hypothetical protein
MRNIEIDKFESISAYILEFIEQYTKLTPEEIAKLKDNTKARGKGDMTLREKILLLEKTKDLQFSLWGNVQGKSVMHKKIEFGNYECAMPMNKTTMTIIFRCLWTSYDYCSADLIQDDIVVGGVVDFQMFSYPTACQKSNSKFKNLHNSCVSYRVGHEVDFTCKGQIEEFAVPRVIKRYRNRSTS